MQDQLDANVRENPMYFSSVTEMKNEEVKVETGVIEEVYEPDLLETFAFSDQEAKSIWREKVGLLMEDSDHRNKCENTKVKRLSSFKQIFNSATLGRLKRGGRGKSSLTRSKSMSTTWGETNDSQLKEAVKKTNSLTHKDVVTHTTLSDQHLSNNKGATGNAIVNKRSSLHLNLNCEDMSIATQMSPGSADRPPLPPARTNCSQLKQEDFLICGRQHHHKRSHAVKVKQRSVPVRPHVLHKTCQRKHLPGLVNGDVVIIYSVACKISCEWATYFRTLLCTQQSSRSIFVQDVETLSQLASKSQEVDKLSMLTKLEESTFHAKAKLVILSRTFLDWVYTHPDLIVGNLLSDSNNVLGLLLGTKKEDIKPEHRASLLTYPNWRKLLTITNDQISQLSTVLVSTVAEMMDLQQAQENTYLVPRASKKFKLWPPEVTVDDKHDKFLLVLSEKVSCIEKVEVYLCFDQNVIKIPASWFSDNMVEATVSANVMREAGNKSAVVDLRVGSVAWCQDSDNKNKQVHFSSNSTQIFQTPSVLGILGCKTATEMDQNMSESITAAFPPNLFSKTANRAQSTPDDARLEFPTFLHWAAYHGLYEASEKLLSLPGGQNCLSRKNMQGQTPCEVALAKGHRFLADILRKVPNHDYEYPINLRNCSDKGARRRHCSSNSVRDARKVYAASSEGSKSEPSLSLAAFSLDNLNNYDVPRPAENLYLVPPKPRPVEVKADVTKTGQEGQNKSSYIPMQPRSNSTGSSQPKDAKETMKRSNSLNSATRPQSRQEILTSYMHTNNEELLLEEESLNEQQLEKPAADSIVKGFEPTNLNAKSFKANYEKCQTELIELQKKFIAEELTLNQVEEKFAQWKAKPEVLLANEKHRTELENMRLEWQTVQNNLKLKENSNNKTWSLIKSLSTSSLKRGRKRSENNNNNLGKFSTLPSMPMKRKSLPPKNEKPIVRANSTCSNCSDNYEIKSDSSWSAETQASIVDQFLLDSLKPTVPPKVKDEIDSHVYDVPRNLFKNGDEVVKFYKNKKEDGEQPNNLLVSFSENSHLTTAKKNKKLGTYENVTL